MKIDDKLSELFCAKDTNTKRRILNEIIEMPELFEWISLTNNKTSTLELVVNMSKYSTIQMSSFALGSQGMPLFIRFTDKLKERIASIVAESS